MNFKILTLLSLLSLVFAGCETEGPAEKAGKKIDESIQNLKEKAHDVMEDQGPAEKTDEKIDQAVENVKEKSQDLRDRLQEKLPNLQRSPND